VSVTDRAEPDHAAHRARRDQALRRSITSGGGVRLLTVAFALLTVSVSVRALGDSAFGAVATLGTVVGIAGFADLGLGLGLMTRLAQSHGEDDGIQAKPLVSSALALLVPLGLLVALIGAASSVLLPWERLLGFPGIPSWQVTLSVVIFAVSVGLAIPASIGQRVLLGTQQGALANLWSLAASTAQLAAVLLAAATHAPAPAFVAATITVPVLVESVQSVWVLRTRDHLTPARAQASRQMAGQLMRVGGLFLALNIAVALSYQSDSLIVSSVMGAASAAVFAIGLRLFGTLSSLFASSLQQLWPALAEALGRGDLVWVRHRFRQVLLLSTAVLAGLSGLLVVFGQPLARLWVGPSLVPPLELLLAFAAWTVYSHVMSQCSILLNAARVVGPQVAMATAMTCVNLPVSIVLTRQVGLAGPLLGSLIAHVLCAGLPTAVLVRRVLRHGDLRAGTT
jgi:O-antigen/teichoic acid export membrane protein